MRLSRYLSSHLFALVCDVTAVALLALLLDAMEVGRDACVLACGVTALLLAMAGLHDYLRERRLVRELSRIADLGDGAVDAARLLEEPGYPEGDAVVGAIANVVRDAQGQVGQAQDDTRAYRRYVETWVHEVKTPLAAIRLFLQNHDEPELEPLHQEVDRLEGYVEQALYYARSFSVDSDFLVRDCALDALVRDAVRPRAHALIEAHVSVDLAGLAPGGRVPRVSCDPKWMAFVLGQLVDNALRYRADPATDGRSPRVEFAARVEGAGSADERVLLDVADNGCGISEADLPRVFDRGFTGDNGRSHAHSTGMGLYLVRTLCQRMGLSVGIASERDGAGRPGWTRVTIAFPRCSNLTEA